MANVNVLKKILKHGLTVGEMSQAKAEAVAKSLVKSGDLRRRDAKKLVGTLVGQATEQSERMAAGVAIEVANQLQALANRIEVLEGHLESAGQQLSIRANKIGDASSEERGKPSKADVINRPKPAKAKKASAKATKAPAKPSAKRGTPKVSSSTNNTGALKSATAPKSATPSKVSSAKAKTKTSSAVATGRKSAGPVQKTAKPVKKATQRGQRKP